MESTLKKFYKKLVLALFIGIAVSCTAQKENNNINKILPQEEFQKTLTQSDAAILIDVRTQGEFAAGAISGAKNYDIMDGTFEKEIAKLNKANPVFVYCASGGRSGKAAKILKEKGFKEIYDLKGGYNSWK